MVNVAPIKIDDMRLAPADYFSVSAENVVARIFNDSGKDRIEMNVRDDLAKVDFGIYNTSPIPTLPKPAQISVPPVVGTGDLPLKSCHRSPKVDGPCLHHQVVVVAHETPCENCPAIEIPNFSQSLDELNRFEVVVKDELTPSDAAVDMVRGPWNEQARVSRHGIAPMRGRDNLILLGNHLKATMVHSERGTHQRGTHLAPIKATMVQW